MGADRRLPLSKEMNHYVDMDPHLIRERNEQIRREVHSLRLEERLGKERNSHGSRVSVLVKRRRPLIERGRLAG